MFQGESRGDGHILIPDVRSEVFWDGLGDCYEQGLVKAVGVSNYGNLSHDSCMTTCQTQSDPIRPKELRTGILRHTAGFSHVLARGTWVYVDFIDMKVFGPYLPSGSSAVRAISKTLGERGIPLTSNQIQHLGPLGPVTQATDKPWHGE